MNHLLNICNVNGAEVYFKEAHAAQMNLFIS